ncbi:MAG: PDDEXK nuclease domain-containing protein [Treponema sp.]|nr:PDDEXK nuclease domain-containing protein [Treponema sp.]
MGKQKPKIVSQKVKPFDENKLFEMVVAIIEKRKNRAATYANREINLMFWEIGKYINSVILDFKRAPYGKKIFSTLSRKLATQYGKSFQEENLYRMTQFANMFTDTVIVKGLLIGLSWSHVCELIRIKNEKARIFYAKDATARHLGVREIRSQIARKAFERTEIANTQLAESFAVPFNVFKDPYLLDILELKENYLEAYLEKAILLGLENFILEFGHGFTFVARQKRMIIDDDDDFTLDLLFYHRLLKRFIAIELKLGKFKPQYKGQMEFYLKWLNRHERTEDENAPIGLILCTEASHDQIELMEMDRAGIAVAEYWTVFPPKSEFEQKIKELTFEARERLERRKPLPTLGIKKQLEYFYEPKDEDGDESQ